MKVRPSVKPMCDKCKVIKEKGLLELFAKTLNINKDKVNPYVNNTNEVAAV